VTHSRPPRLPLSKSLHPSDYGLLTEELHAIDLYGVAGQATDHRRWEYAMALYTLQAWKVTEAEDQPHHVLDVGGAGSPFIAIAQGVYPQTHFDLVDPTVNHAIEASEIRDGSYDAIFSISTLEHVNGWRGFLRSCVRHLRPGGLLFLTVDYWDCEGKDDAHFHWMRERIYNRTSLEDVRGFLKTLGVHRFGGVDTKYHGNHIYGSYTFASLALRKEP
jgi:SAM-dependent methyltransferase